MADLTCKTCDWFHLYDPSNDEKMGACRHALVRETTWEHKWCSEHSGIAGNKRRVAAGQIVRVGDEDD